MIVALEVVETLVREATGPLGLLVAAVYSFLVAVALPFPGELVLAIPLDTRFGPRVDLAALIVASSLGKAVGSVLALRLGNGARTGLVERWLDGLPTVVALDENPVTRAVSRHGYLGLGVGLAIPLFPDTATIYAFSVLETNYVKFALAAFLGTVVRLLIVAGIVGGAMAVV